MEIVVLVVSALLGVVFLSLLERKILRLVQIRRGPNKVIINGLFQSLVDGGKLFFKEQLKLFKVPNLVYFFLPSILVVLTLGFWLIYPIFWGECFKFEYSLLFLVRLARLEAYFILFIGWFSRNKFRIISTIRGVRQVISYEVIIILLILVLVYVWRVYSLIGVIKNINNLVDGVWIFLPMLLIFIFRTVVEIFRSPTDLLEGESELVSGFNIEYMSYGLSLIFIREFSTIIIYRLIIIAIFYSGLLFLIIGLIFSFIILFIRAIYPRFLYYKLIMLLWKVLIPLSLGVFFIFFVF